MLENYNKTNLNEQEAFVSSAASFKAKNHNLLKQTTNRDHSKSKRNISPIKKSNLSALHSAEAIRNKSLFRKEKQVSIQYRKHTRANLVARPQLADENLLCSTPKEETGSHIEYITVNYLENLKANLFYRMENLEVDKSQSFIDNFFENKSVTEDRNELENAKNLLEQKNDIVSVSIPNEHKIERYDSDINGNIPGDKDDESVNIIEVDSNENNAENSVTKDEVITSFLDSLFERKNVPDVKLPDPKPIKIVEANKKEESKPLFDTSTNSVNKFSMNSNKKVEIDDTLKYLREWKPQTENPNLTRIIANYLQLYTTLNDKRVVFFSNTRSKCMCIRNALGCCLQNFYIQIHTFVPISEHRLVKDCCHNCERFNSPEFLHTNSPQNNSPDWLKYFSLLDIKKRFGFVNDALEVSQLLRESAVQKFLTKTHECTCFSLECCLKSLRALTTTDYQESQIVNFQKFLCCQTCFMKASKTPARSDSNHLSGDRNYPSLHSSSSSEDEEPVVKVPINQLEGSLVSSIDDFFNVVHISRQFKARTLTKNKSKPTHVQQSEEKIPLSELRSTIKNHQQLGLNNTNSKSQGGGGKKEKCVRFYDPRKGFYPVQLKEWQDNLRDPVYSSDTTVSNPEWQNETSKNDYPFTKSQCGSFH